MLKIVPILAVVAAISALSAPVQAQIKAGIPLKSKETIRVEKQAAAERKAMRAAAKAGDRHAQVFASADADRDGRVNLKEFKEAALALEGADQRR
jgi:hypothetical protein